MSGHTPWARLREQLRQRRDARRDAVASATAMLGGEQWDKLHAIATLAGHRPSDIADASGGYLCACRQASWSHLATFGPHGGCPAGWYDAREFLARYGVASEADFEARRRHHQFGHRNGLTTFSHDNPLCRRYECVEATEEDR